MFHQVRRDIACSIEFYNYMTCCICYEDIGGEEVSITCSYHRFHAGCVLLWVLSAGRLPKCPVCSTDLLIRDQRGKKSTKILTMKSPIVHSILSDLIKDHATFINSSFINSLMNSLESNSFLIIQALLKLKYGEEKLRTPITGRNKFEMVTLALIENETEYEVFCAFASKFGLSIPSKLVIPFYTKYYLSITDLAPDAFHAEFPTLCQPVRRLILSLMGAPSSVFTSLARNVLIPLSIARDDFNTFYDQISTISTSRNLSLGIKLSIQMKKIDFLELALGKHSEYGSVTLDRIIFDRILKANCKKWMIRAKFYECKEVIDRWLPYNPKNTKEKSMDVYRRLKMLPIINEPNRN